MYTFFNSRIFEPGRSQCGGSVIWPGAPWCSVVYPILTKISAQYYGSKACRRH